MEKQYACSSCGYEQSRIDRVCERCGSCRVVLISVLESVFGDDWRSIFESTLDEISEIAKQYGEKEN